MIPTRQVVRGAKLVKTPVMNFAARQLLFGAAARKRMLEGCVNLADAVAVTLGPGGYPFILIQT